MPANRDYTKLNTNYVPTNVWPPYKRANNRSIVPIGYMIDPNDEMQGIVNPELKPLLEEALDYVDAGHGYREAGKWLGERLGRTVSHTAMQHMWEKVRKVDKNNPRARHLKKMARKNAPKTPKDKAELEVKRRIQGAKASLTKQTKKLETFKDPVEEFEPIPEPIIADSDVAEAVFEDKNIVFKPNPGPQETFLAASEQEVLYGGAAGGGKSYALLADPMRYFGSPKFNGLLVRRTNDELRELKWKSRELYPRAFPGATWREKDSMWLFPSGAQFWMTYLERDEDVTRYQGQAFTYIAFDELTHWPTPFAWNYMRSRLRTASDGSDTEKLPVFMRATTNPGGVGHGWVKRMFIDPAPHGQAFNATDIETGAELKWPDNHPTKAGLPLFQRRFIPARLSDNPYLYNDGQYEANLLSMSENARRQLLEGDWSVADGAAFPEFRYSIHTCKPFEVPHEWKRFRSCDYGYNSFSAVHWYAIDPAFDTLYVYRELYVTKKTGADLSHMVKEAELRENVQYGMLDSSVWHQRGQTGPSVAEEMILAGTRWRPADRSSGSRTNGKNRLHELLKVNEDTGKPGIIFFENCRQIIADLPIIPADPDGQDDIDVRYASDHAYDSIRYGIMSRPRANTPFDFSSPITSSYRPASLRVGY